MNLARAIHLDESDTLVFHRAARTGEWLISGGFEFSNWDQSDLTGKARQAFTNGWLGLESFGRATFAAVTRIEPGEMDTLADNLAQHFVTVYGAPDLEAARVVALDELRHMADMCDGQSPNTLLTVARELTDAGVNEAFRIIAGREANLIQIAGDGCS
jgi:Family of unknown function (DUF6505)